MANSTVKLAALREKQAQLLAKISKLENRNKQEARKEDTRLKILIGAAMLADANIHPETAKLIKTILARAITTPRDQEFLAAKSWL
jgi:hypothetical protein